MAGTATPIFPQTVMNWAQQITNANGTSLQTLVTGGTNGSKVESLMISNTDTVAHDVQFWVTISSVAYLLTTVSIPASAGNSDSVPAVDILRSAQIPGLAYDPNGNKYLYVANGSTLSIGLLVAVASGKLVQGFAQGGNF
ncbi:MAG TPA: hypothetical protein V6C97_08805 [Oculatellaceae cyanobacterium]